MEANPKTIPVSKTSHLVCHPSKQHAFSTSSDEPTRLTKATPATATPATRPVNQPVLPRGGRNEWGMRLRVRQRGARRVVEFSTNYNAPHPSSDHAPPTHMGGHQQADPTEWGLQNRSSVMGDRSTHDERGGRGSSRGRDFGGPGDGCRGWRPSGVWSRTGEEEVGRAEQNVIFLYLGCFLSFFVWRNLRGRRSGNPARIDHFDLGWDMVKGGKMVVAVQAAPMALQAACSAIVK